MIRGLPAIAFPALLVSTAGAQGLGGALAQDGVLGAEGSPHEVGSTLSIPAGVTLTLQPGAVLKFGPGASLVVQGTLSGTGGSAAESMISLVSRDSGTFWGRIDVQGGKVDLARAFVVGGGILVRSGEAAVKDSVIAGCEVGLTLMGGKASVSGCRISKNKAGIDLASPRAVLSVQGSEISQNGYGVAARAFQAADFKGNRFQQNQMSLANLSAQPLDVSGNWWGTQDGAEISKAVLDREDDARYGPVQVRPLFGEAAVALAPTPAPQPAATPVPAPEPTPVPAAAVAAVEVPAEPDVPEEGLWDYGDPYLDMKGLPWEGPKAKTKKMAVGLGSMAAVAVAVLLLL